MTAAAFRRATEQVLAQRRGGRGRRGFKIPQGAVLVPGHALAKTV
jgi:hypothetical protein